MNEALQRWREDFARDPGTALDRLVRGVVPLGGASQLSLGEILDVLFEPSDAALDTTAAGWLEKHILGPVPENTSLHRWVSVLEEYFRGIAAMELPQTGEILRRQHKRLRLWLHGFYEGSDRDPEGAYLIALARAQDDQRFSPLWRRLILGEELAGRTYLGIGILGFRKMPDQDSNESSGVPEGLLQAMVELAEKPGTGQAKWKQTMRSLFATYRRSESYWVEHLAPLLPHYQHQSNARDWLSAMLPGIPSWRPPTAESHVSKGRVRSVPPTVSQDWANRIRMNPDLCDTPAFSVFLDHHRKFAKATGEVGYINKSFNNLAISIIRADDTRVDLALSLIEEALEWAPSSPHNWTSYAIVLCAAHRERDAIDILWEARQRFPWNCIIRNELGRILRETHDYEASAEVLRETAYLFPNDLVCRQSLVSTLMTWVKLEEATAVIRQAIKDLPDQLVLRNMMAEKMRTMGLFDEAHKVYEQTCHDFPADPVCRTGLAETLRAMERFDDAVDIYKQACIAFPDNDFCRNAFADLLVDLDQLDQAEIKFREALRLNKTDPVARGGLARVLSILSARKRDKGLRNEAKRLLQELANEGDNDARKRLRVFDDQWERATIDRTVTFRRETEVQQTKAHRPQHSRAITEMGVAERLGRAMITLGQAERAEDVLLRTSLCANATALLEVPENQIDDELIAAFLETRGLVLLASGDARKALDYFEEQIHHYGRGGWIGIQLGDERARIVLGLPRDADETVEAPSSQSARFALYVAQVIQKLSSVPQESEVREVLKILYPRAADYAARAQPNAEGGISIESGAEMLGTFLQTRWFRPAGIKSVEDLDRPDALHAVVERINNTRTDAFDVISNSALALTA
jgi:tetratricopeptide (TPR) repeat protein